MDYSNELEPFRVLFVVSPKTWVDADSRRALNILALCREDGHVRNHRKDFYQVTTLDHFKNALEEPKHLQAPVIHAAGLDRLLSIAPPLATVVKPDAARLGSEPSETAASAHASGK